MVGEIIHAFNCSRLFTYSFSNEYDVIELKKENYIVEEIDTSLICNNYDEDNYKD